ncbi:hypothetical protein SAMN05421693_105106 [Ectothiorhodospira magna]|uniref:DUF2059 domain-containing protein n=1 Tax=Ectothiorhodospira magna TaxID=867345 RepID=A0A1H9AJF4_9GAMM|nr:hypothetical protein [Ectothiorhodospira magna]SEP76886.1 hypothetical protein SAMN05421693_105106 [Ectothiorhodospira magna]
MLRSIAVLASLFFLLTGQVLAMNLTASDIERFMATYQQILPHIDEEDFEDDDEDDELKFLDIQAMQGEFMAVLAGNQEAERIIRSNGYPTVATFATQSAHILRAYIAHTSMVALDEFQAALQDMPAEEREALMAMPFFQSLQNTRAQMAEVPSAEIRAVLPYMEQLDMLFAMGDADGDDFD